MISLVDYSRFVFGENIWEKAGEEVKKAFENTFVNFSHWVSMIEIISVPKNGINQLGADEWTLRHWHLTGVVQCGHNLPLVDKMIPITSRATI